MIFFKKYVFFLFLVFSISVEATKKTDKTDKCQLIFRDTVANNFLNLEYFAEAMTKNLFLTREQADLFYWYRRALFGDPKFYISHTFNDLMDLLDKYPELVFSKKTFREQILIFEEREYENPESLKTFIHSFHRSYAKIKSLFFINANIGVWRKLLSFKENQEVKEYLRGFLSPMEWVFLADPSAHHKQKVLVLYRVLDKIREDKVKKYKLKEMSLTDKENQKFQQQQKKISQVMLDLVHTIGFSDTTLNNLIKSPQPEKQLEALYRMLDKREVVAKELGFTFSEMKDYLLPSHLKPKEDIYDLLQGIKKELEQSYHVKDIKEMRVRALSVQESPFRSCLGSECSSNSYFEKALDPNFYYFTLTDKNNYSSGQVTVVLGIAQGATGERIKVAFVDKIQNIRNEILFLMLEAIRRSLEEKGYKLGLPEKVGGEEGLSNFIPTRDVITNWIKSQKQNRLNRFKPHNNTYRFKKGFSRAYTRPNLFEFTDFSDQMVQMVNGSLRPGSIYLLKKAPAYLGINNIYENFLRLSQSPKEQDQRDFLDQLKTLFKEKSFPLSEKQVEKILENIIKNGSFSLRKKALFTMMEWYIEISKNFNYKRVMELLDLFNHKEQKEILGEMSNWQNSRNKNRKDFITHLVFKNTVRNLLSLLNSKLTEVFNINIRNINGETLLTWASWVKNTELVKLLVEQGANIHVKDKGGNTALIQSSGISFELQENPKLLMASAMEITKFLINSGADIHAQNDLGDTAFMRTAQSGLIEIAQLLIDKGVNIDTQNILGETALMKAGRNGHTEMVKFLIEQGADIHIKDNMGNTVLAHAGKYIEVVKLLVESGADIHTQNRFRDTVLIQACQSRYIETAIFLMEQGVDIHVQNKLGDTAFILASGNGLIKIVELLLQKGANIDEQNKAGNTAFMRASQNSYLETAKFLMEQGADISIKNQQGETALAMVKRYGNKEIQKLIQSFKRGRFFRKKNGFN